MPLTDLLVCPACRGDLAPGALRSPREKSRSPEARETSKRTSDDPPSEVGGIAFHCDACDVDYPSLGTVACLLPDPQTWRTRWREQLGRIHLEGEETIDTFESEQRRPGLLASTRKRLGHQVALTRQVLAEVDALLAPVGAWASPQTPMTGFRPMEMVHLLHRDWGWPHSDENQRALELVTKVLPPGPLGRVLVLGAGACRLAYDLHRTRAVETTVAIDIDPLALLAANPVIHGQRITLTEPRANATELEQLSAVRTLEAPHGAVDNLHLLLADGLRPPVRAGSFDTLVTPWFIDVVPPDLRELLGELDRALAPNGRWIHFGPLLYPSGRPLACRYSREEVYELAQLAGFELEASESEVLTYALSPLTERGRLERCLAFSARKSSAPPKGAWLVLPHLSVPAFSSEPHPSAAFRAVLELVDGVRSINDITAAVIARSGTQHPGVKDSVRHCLSSHPDLRS